MKRQKKPNKIPTVTKRERRKLAEAQALIIHIKRNRNKLKEEVDKLN
jgi:hypothetical protein